MRAPKKHTVFAAEDDDEEREDLQVSEKANAAEIHKEMPGKLGFDMIMEVTKKAKAKEEFLPCVHDYTGGIIKT